MSFAELGLADELLRAVHEQGYTIPTPIQAQTIPVILDGKDVLAGAQTGTGKTAGFTLPLLHRLNQLPAQPAKKFRPVRALIVVPTRELASQVSESVQTYGKFLPLRSNVVFGGVKISPQIFKLRRGCDVLVATPGRLLDLVNQRVLDLSKVETLVLDEADRMLDMGFLPDIRRIIALLPKERQNLLFSATYSPRISQLANTLLTNPVTIEVAHRNSVAEKISHLVHPVPKDKKRQLLSFLIGSNNWQQVLVFAKTKHGADRLAKQLCADGLRADAIHGNKTQGARSRALADFKDGKIRVLVATDIAARGLDINQLSHVVNYELPMVAEDYVHRIGRTGRAGNEGHAISLVGSDEVGLLKDIERLLKRDVDKEIIAGYEPDFSMNSVGSAARKPQRNSRPSNTRPSNNGYAGRKEGGSQPRSTQSRSQSPSAQARTGSNGNNATSDNSNANPYGNSRSSNAKRSDGAKTASKDGGLYTPKARTSSAKPWVKSSDSAFGERTNSRPGRSSDTRRAS